MKSFKSLFLLMAFAISTVVFAHPCTQDDTKKSKPASTSSCDSYNQFAKKRGKRTLPTASDSISKTGRKPAKTN